MSPDEKGAAERGTVLLITTLASFLVPFMGSSINVALPSIGKEFAMNAVYLSWVAMSYLLTVAILLVPLGRVADLYGRKKLFLMGMSIHVSACFLVILSNSPLILIGSRALQGIGGAMIFGTSVAVLTSIFPPEQRGRVLGINAAAVYTGLSAGPPIGGLLTQHVGWRSLFVLNIPIGLLIVFMVVRKLKGEWAEAHGERFDLIGSAIYSLALLALIYGLSLLPSVAGAGFILAGAAGVIGFVRYEMRADTPIFDLRLLRDNRVFAASNLAALINYSATFAVTFLISLYLQYTKGFTPQKAGIVLMAQPVMQAVISPFAGRLSDKVEPRAVASVGMGLSVAGLVLFAFLGEDTPIWYVMGNLILLGLGFALFSSPNTNAVMSSVEKKYYGVASGILGTMRSLGMTFSMGMVMVLFSVLIGRVQIAPIYYPAFLKSVRIAFAFFAALCLAGVFASLSRGKLR